MKGTCFTCDSLRSRMTRPSPVVNRILRMGLKVLRKTLSRDPVIRLRDMTSVHRKFGGLTFEYVVPDIGTRVYTELTPNSTQTYPMTFLTTKPNPCDLKPRSRRRLVHQCHLGQSRDVKSMSRHFIETERIYLTQ